MCEFQCKPGVSWEHSIIVSGKDPIANAERDFHSLSPLWTRGTLVNLAWLKLIEQVDMFLSLEYEVTLGIRYLFANFDLPSNT